jgi:hypothetical protein
MEDLSILWEDSLEEDFVNLLEANWKKEMFLEMAQKMMPEWKKLGRNIIKKNAPHLLKRFDEYAK